MVDGTTAGNWAIRVYDATCATTVYATDCIGNSGNGGVATSIDWGFAPNTCYTARIWVKTPGNFTLCTSAISYPNDECVVATPIDQIPQTDNNYCATSGPFTNTPTNMVPGDFCAGSLENTAWYSFTVLNTADVIITIENISCSGGAQGFQIGYFTGICGSLTNLGCQSGSGGTVTATISGLTAGEQVFIGIDGNAGANCTYDISATNTVLLGTDIAYFSAKNIGDHIKLDCQIDGPTDHIEKYVFERSLDANQFYEIGELLQIEPSGHFIFTDMNPLSNTSYYRLKVLGLDESIIYSDVISNYRQSSDQMGGFYIHSVYPQPVSDVLTIDLESTIGDQIDIRIFNSLGQIMLNKNGSVINEGRQKIDLSLEMLNSGVYTLTVENKLTKKRINKRIILN